MKIQDIKIQTVTTEVLKDFLNIKLEPKQELQVFPFAVWKDKYALDTDCIFWELQQEHVKETVETVLRVECIIKYLKDDGSYTVKSFKPDFIKTILLSDYLKLSKEIKLVDFIRFNYNPRIMSNQKLFMSYIKSA